MLMIILLNVGRQKPFTIFKIMSSKALLIISSTGYQPMEYGATKAVLEQSGIKVATGSDKLGKAKAVDGTTTEAEVKVNEVNINDYSALFFIGGPGALASLDNGDSYNLLRAWQASGKPFGAICISPRILAKAGVLKNKKATGWDGDGKLSEVFNEFGVEYVRENVVVDGNVITANGPLAAEEFGRKIVGVLIGVTK